eukprot:364247-Chlamydomonas_euryale.AAC.25
MSLARGAQRGDMPRGRGGAAAGPPVSAVCSAHIPFRSSASNQSIFSFFASPRKPRPAPFPLPARTRAASPFKTLPQLRQAPGLACNRGRGTVGRGTVGGGTGDIG